MLSKEPECCEGCGSLQRVVVLHRGQDGEFVCDGFWEMFF